MKKIRLKSINVRTCLLTALALGMLIAVLYFLFIKRQNPDESDSFIQQLLDCDEETAEYYEQFLKTAEIYKDEDVTISLEYVLFNDVFLSKYTVKSEKEIYTEEDRGSLWGFEEIKHMPNGSVLGDAGYEFRLEDGNGKMPQPGSSTGEIKKTDTGLEIYEKKYIIGEYHDLVCTVNRKGENKTIIPLKITPSTKVSFKHGDDEIFFTPHILYGFSEKKFDKIEVAYAGGEKIAITNISCIDDAQTNMNGIKSWYRTASERQKTDDIEAVYIDGVSVDFVVSAE